LEFIASSLLSINIFFVKALRQWRQIREAMKRWNVKYGKKLKQWNDEAFNAGKTSEAMKRLTLHASLHRFIASLLHRFIASSLHRFIASSLHRFIASSLHRFIASSLLVPSFECTVPPPLHTAAVVRDCSPTYTSAVLPPLLAYVAIRHSQEHQEINLTCSFLAASMAAADQAFKHCGHYCHCCHRHGLTNGVAMTVQIPPPTSWQETTALPSNHSPP
jgi:hypothetical protein